MAGNALAGLHSRGATAVASYEQEPFVMFKVKPVPSVMPLITMLPEGTEAGLSPPTVPDEGLKVYAPAVPPVYGIVTV
jgi:hypothetical protein